MTPYRWIAVLFAVVILAIGYVALSRPGDQADQFRELAKRERQTKPTDILRQQLAKESSSSDTVAEVVLPADRQKLIWELEHDTFELEWKFGKLIKDALKHGSKEELLARFKPDFQGQLPATDNQRLTRSPLWHQHETATQEELVSANAETVAEFLLDVVSDLTEIKKLGLRVLAIDPIEKTTDQFRLTLLIYAKGDSFLGPASLDSTHTVEVQYQSDEEIAAGQIVRRWTVNSVVSRGTAKPLFGEITAATGLDALELPDNWRLALGEPIDTYTSQVAVDDFDRDGDLDIAISTLQGRQYLLRADEQGRYEDVTHAFGLPGKKFYSLTTFATWIDYDRDHYPDLLLGKNLYHNVRGERFEQVTSRSGLELTAATMGAIVADYDCDGWLDLYILNHNGDRGKETVGFIGDDKTTGVANVLYRNLGNGRFEDVTEQAGVSGDQRHSFAGAWYYANDDHYPDLYLVNDFARNCLFINRGDGSFEEIAEQAAVGDFANSMGVATGDLNNDGTSEVYVANMFSKMGRRIIAHVSEEDYPPGIYKGIQGACAGSHLYQRSGEGNDLRYDEISEQKGVNAIGWAYAPVMADFDGDGLLDIYATSGFISVDRRKPDG